MRHRDAKGKKNLPPDFETVMAIVDAFHFRPSRLVDSGRGVHAYWVFTTTVELDGDDEINNAARLAELFHRTIVIPAVASVGVGDYEVDSVFDLPRVLRLPGSTHINTGRVVTEIHGKKGGVFGDLYDHDELTAEVERLAKKQKIKPKKSTRRADDPSADDWDLTRGPQHTVVEILKKNTRFVQILKNKASDLPSPSEVDFAVACICLNLGIEDEETARVLVWIRQEMGVTPKRGSHSALVDYYQTTLANAKERRGDQDELADVAQRVKDEQNTRPAQAPTPKSVKGQTKTKDAPIATNTPNVALSEGMRVVALETIRKQLGLPLLRILKYHSHSPLYEIHFEGSNIPVECRIEDIVTPKNFQARVAAVTDKLIPSFTRKDWDNVAALLLSVVERADLDLTTKTQLEEWLNDYLENMPPSAWDDRANAYPRPFYMETRPPRVALSVANFATFIRRQGIGSISTGDIRIRMKQANWTRVLVPFPKLTKKKSATPDQERYLWTLELSGFWRDRALESIEQRDAAERESAESRSKQQTELNDDGTMDVPF